MRLIDVEHREINKSLDWTTQMNLDESQFMDMVACRIDTLITGIRERHRAHASNDRKRNPQKYRNWALSYYRRHPEKMRQLARNHRKKRNNDPTRLARYREWCVNNVRRRKKTDVEYLIRFKIRGRIWGALKRGTAKAGNTVELLGCTISEYKQYLESLWLPGMNWDNYGRHGWHIDHIIPCKAFNLTDPEQQKKCFHYTNTRPMWEFDNLSKGANMDTGAMYQKI